MEQDLTRTAAIDFTGFFTLVRSIETRCSASSPPRLVSHPPLARPLPNRRLSSPRSNPALFSPKWMSRAAYAATKRETRNSPARAHWTGRVWFVIEISQAVRMAQPEWVASYNRHLPAASCQPETHTRSQVIQHLVPSEIPGCCGTVMHLQGAPETCSLPADGAVRLAPVPD
ncbi:hypothetical protein CCMA1212_003769 [Trichoderma ghanense]|uniref:Uncharacterized protein n=1 Tax=Trichoderma ghanense TaxID=65468 RepID=A0ABY2H8P9_9HYPO